MTEEGLGQLQVIWGALVGGVVLYTLLIFVLMTAGTLDIASLDPSIMNMVGAAVMVYLVGGIIVRRTMVGAIPDDADRSDKIQRYRVAIIVPMALMESGGLIVITLGLLSGSATWVLAGGGAAAALMLMARPSADEIGI